MFDQVYSDEEESGFMAQCSLAAATTAAAAAEYVAEIYEWANEPRQTEKRRSHSSMREGEDDYQSSSVLFEVARKYIIATIASRREVL